MANSTVNNTASNSNAVHLCAGVQQKQPVYTIHTDAQVEWNRRVCNIQLVPSIFTDHDKAAATLATVRRTNPRAFIKTKFGYVA